jgi:hypothetical protein
LSIQYIVVKNTNPLARGIDKMKKTCPTAGTVSDSNRKIVETDAKSISLA